MEDFEERIAPDAKIRLASERIPITWNYNADMIIGHASLNDDGASLDITITDPKMVEIFKLDRKRVLNGLSVSAFPAVPAVPQPRPEDYCD